MSDARVPLGPVFDAFGLPATVTRPGQDPIETTIVWIFPSTDLVPAETPFQVADRRRLMAIRKSAVPTLPRDTVVEAAEEQGGSERAWIVDSIERIESDHYRALVKPQDETT